jgi:hypothetical protein
LIYALAHFKYRAEKKSFSSLYEATTNELQGSGMEIVINQKRSPRTLISKNRLASDFSVAVEGAGVAFF